ncbi:SLAC1 family transporter [Novosphingobium panipatense]
MSAHTLSKTASVPRLAHLPLPLFAAPMGFGGIGLAWREAARVLGAPKLIGEALFAMTVALWLIVTALHIIRALHSPASLLGDLKHPVRSGFTGAIAIGMMLIAGGVLPYSPSIAAVIWFGAIGLQVALGIWFLRALFHTPREAATFTPLLLMPLIGNVVAPIVGAKLGFVVISWMLFGMGIALWVSVQPLLFGRIFTGPPAGAASPHGRHLPLATGSQHRRGGQSDGRRRPPRPGLVRLCGHARDHVRDDDPRISAHAVRDVVVGLDLPDSGLHRGRSHGRPILLFPRLPTGAVGHPAWRLADPRHRLYGDATRGAERQFATARMNNVVRPKPTAAA